MAAIMAVPINSWIGNYRVLELLGAGGMGEVYLVEEGGTGRRRAMKTLLSGGPDSEVWRRFFNEGRVQHEINHPNIAAFHEMFLFEERPCLVMEYVDGETLWTRIQRTGALATGEALEILGRLCDALAYLHVCGIMHRDIKSANIKLTSSGLVKLLDFGIARSPRTPRMTVSGAVMGTPDYMAPEQIAGLPADGRSEVWALGLLAYEMLTGSLPFSGDDDVALFRAIRETEPHPPSALNPEVPRGVDAIVMRCLDKRPTRRYASPAEMGSAIAKVGTTPSRSWLGSEPRALQSLRRLPRSVRIAALAIPALIAILMFTTSSGTPEDMRTITLEVVEGSADVYANGSRVGRTPYRTRVRVGDSVSVELRKDGYLDQPVQFEVTERKTYSYAMQPSGLLR
jgi:serine/threonine protein kinase